MHDCDGGLTECTYFVNRRSTCRGKENSLGDFK